MTRSQAQGELPADLAAALAAHPGRWHALAPSHRRELVRWLDAAGTPQSRARRIGQIVEQVLGREVGSPGRRPDRELWTCPRCSRSFVTRNMSHSCAVHSLDESLAKASPDVLALWERLRAVVESFGAVRLVPYRDHVAFMVRVRFAGATPRRRWLDVGFWLTRRVDSPRMHKVETLTPYTHIHTVRLTPSDHIDDELTGWLREAHAVGRQEHLQVSRPRSRSAAAPAGRGVRRG
jgi:hypothetical protein